MGKLIKSTRLGEKINGKAYAKMPCFLKKKVFSNASKPSGLRDTKCSISRGFWIFLTV